MATRILTDSAADFTPTEAKQLGIDVLAMKLLFDGKEYVDGVDFTPQEFYARLRAATALPKTSQVNAFEFKEYFEDALKSGDDVVAILISSKLSGSYHSAEMGLLEAKNETKTDGNVFIIDSETVTTPQKALVLEAVKMRDEGLSASEIAERIEKLKKRVKLFAAICDLKYLRDNGRLSNGAAFLGMVLNVKPVITISSGQVVAINKCLGMIKAKMTVCKEALDKSIDFDMPIYIGHTDSEAEAKSLLAMLEKKAGRGLNAKYEFIGSTVGIHAGPDSAAVVFFEKE